MRAFFCALADRLDKNTQPLNRYEGFNEHGAIVLQDRRGTRKADVSEKAATLSADPLAMSKLSARR